MANPYSFNMPGPTRRGPIRQPGALGGGGGFGGGGFQMPGGYGGGGTVGGGYGDRRAPMPNIVLPHDPFGEEGSGSGSGSGSGGSGGEWDGPIDWENMDSQKDFFKDGWGSQLIMDSGALRPPTSAMNESSERAIRDRGTAQMRAAQTGNRLSAGGDPMLENYLSVMGDMNTGNQQATEMNQGLRDNESSYRQLMREFAMNKAKFAWQWYLDEHNKQKQQSGGGSVGIGPLSFSWGSS